ncbi:transcriptional regulator [Rhizobium cauense]|uniref:transcriptional regulator n=1 Tax=Rhizobium cauense TaxID=1166683 RepID=UPI001C6EFEB9|nr:transcriptional regulator [Rhizobium cauense]MBW9113319.1 transcriptional regulator [Rhizobium cauense]
MSVESGSGNANQPGRSLEIRLLGPMAIRREGIDLKLPGSRKVRSLLAYLALSPRPCGRAQLCDLLWDIPDDPRGELRWCLSKIRSLIGEQRVATQGDTIWLDLSDCFIDAVEAAAAYQHGFKTQTPDRLRFLAALFAGDFHDGSGVERSPAFETWLVSQRRRLRDIHAALLEHMVQRFPPEEAQTYLDRWIQLAPFDLRPHELLLISLAKVGRFREGEEHLEATAKLFNAEGIDDRSLRDAWQTARAQTDAAFRRQQPRANGMPASSPLDTEISPGERRRASIAIMPFNELSAVAVPGGPSDALAYDIITRLAKLRSFHVIAQGTMFALRERHHTVEETARLLGVDYVVDGSFQRMGDRIIVRVELTEARTARIAWAEVFERRVAETFLLLEEIGSRIVVSIEREVETIESNRALMKAPSSLDAWEAHHRGLWHMYRFTKSDNEQAQHFFERAIGLDPTFARAHAGLSFTHFQSAFQHWADRDIEAELAYRAASQSMMADDRDPTAHLAMGRALWLRALHDQSVSELQQAVELSPSFAIAHYSLAFVQSQSGDPNAAILAADHSRALSPFDPLLFGMLASRALALVRLGSFEEAAEWGVKAAARPNAHAHILAIAALCLSIAGRLSEGQSYLAMIHERYPAYRLDDFMSAFHLPPTDQVLFHQGATRLGFA